MKAFDYIQFEEEKHEALIDAFIREHGDDEHGIISDEEFDKLFNLMVEKLGGIAKFVEDGTFDGEDLSASRYVDQLPFIDVVVDNQIVPRKLIEAAILITEEAHRPMGIGFDFETDYIVVFPEGNVIGTFPEAELDLN